jgi:DNA repair protein RadA/Sms
MAKSKSSFQCQQCGCRLSKWAGQCPDCQAWNSIVERASESGPGRRFSGYSGQLSNEVKDLRSIGSSAVERLPVGVGEIDRVLGGGIVPGSVILLGGDPGIGKSTLLLQLVAALSGRSPCLYVTGEESLEQLGMRARRLELSLEDIRCLTETAIGQILGHADKEKPRLLVVDSIQTVYAESLESAPGSV